MVPVPFAGRHARPPAHSARSARKRRTAAVLIATAAGCASYEPSPVDPAQVLAALRAVHLSAVVAAGSEPAAAEHRAPGAADFDLSDGLTADEAAAVAVTLHPGLRALRAEAGIAAAQLVEAGLLPDPTLGWDAMDWIVGGTRDDALSGLGFMQPLPRPGEIPAQEAVAEARIAEVRSAILEREWRLQREVRLAFLGVLAAGERLELNHRFEDIAARTHGFFAHSREVGAATALQENLARLELAEVQREGRRLRLELQRARQALNAHLGLPPEEEFVLQVTGEPFREDPPPPAASALTERAVAGRPDLAELLARYAQAEERLRPEVARQWPALSLGTGVELLLPLFCRFNQPAIATALAVRARLQREVRAAIHRLRSEVHEAVADLELARDQVAFFEERINPQLEESLRLADEALRLGEATSTEILVAQRQALDAHERYLEARIERARARTVVAWVCGEQAVTRNP